MVIWLIGLSGSGKTTLGREIARQWRSTGPSCALLDGDEIRGLFGSDAGDAAYTMRGRFQNAQRMTALCALLDGQGINVVCCILSLFPEMRAENRHRFSRYFEVFLDASMSALVARDSKGLYASAAAGKTRNVAGVDITFERPTTPDLVIDTSGHMPDVTPLAKEVLKRAGVLG